MIKVKSKRILAMLMLVLTLFSTINPSVFATEISSANIQNKGDVEYHLQYWNEEKNTWSYVVTTYTTYSEGGKEYPAYCVNREYPGVGELDGYTVDVNASVTDVLGDVRIWRTIINGFPYKTAGEMGLANDLEAFQATKQAVYCILYNFDPVTRFRGADQGADARGDAIKNAIVNLVNIGRNGSQMPSDPSITLSNSGNLYEDGNYYTQKINVSSTVEMANYTITATANLPQGTIITNSNGTQTNSFNGNESMYVKIPKSQMGQDISNAIINVQGKCKTYPVFYGKTRAEGTQNYALAYDPFGDGVGRATLNIKTNTGKIQVNKTDDETKQPIEGVTFSLKKADGTIVGTATTDKNGIATFDKLYQGNYKLVEVETNPNYVLNTAEFDVNVEYNKTSSVNIENEHKKGNIKVYKIDKDNNRVVLGNVEFDLYSHEFNKVIGTYYTDVNGELEIKNLRTGDYSLIEKNTNKWYNLAEDTDVKVEWNLTKELQIENELKKGSIKIIKVDEEDNEVKLENVKFKVMDKDGNVLEELITDENGEAETSKYPVRDFSELKIQEVETLDTYVLDDEVHTITLEENQIKNVTFENEKIKGQIEVTKVSADDNNLTGDKKGTPLEGVIFEVYNSNDELVDTLTTDSEGKAISKLLVKGQYYLKEVDSGSPYYLINTDIFTAEIKEHKEIVDVNVEDESVDIEVEVEKKGFIETQSKDSIYYNFKNIKNKSNVALDNFTWQDILPTQALRVDRIYTGTWNEDLEYSIWYKTNKNDYKMLVDGLSTQVNNEVSFKTAELDEDEFITEYEFRFGTVKAGFSEVEEPILYCDMLDGLGNGFVFTNYTKVFGNYEDKYVEDIDEWTTVTYFKEIETTQKLPRTGC
jgi:uncharacterized surface anchored protein